MESGNFRPSDLDLPKGDADVFLEQHGTVLDDDGQMVYEEVTFRIPARMRTAKCEDSGNVIWSTCKKKGRL